MASTNSLPGGTSYFLTAHYPGDGTYAASDSVQFGPVTVNPEPSTTTAVALGYPDQNGFPPFTTGPYGTFVYLRADVKGQ